MRRLLLTNTVIMTLALGAPFAFAQSNGGAIEEENGQHPQAPTKGGKAATQAPNSQTAPGKTGAGRSAQAPEQAPIGKTQLNTQAEPQRPGAQAEPQTPAANQRKGPTSLQPRPQGQPQLQGPTGQQRVQVTAQQREQIHERFAHVRTHRIDRASFSIAVGIEVPRSVIVVPLPLEIVEVVPEYRGYYYVMVGDEILIVDPSSLLIVAIIPA